MMSLSTKTFLAFGIIFFNQLISCLGGDRVYTISFTTGTNGNDGTAHPVYFKIYGTNGETEWFKYDSFPLLGHKYEFRRCLDDVGEVEKLDIVRKSEDHSTPSQVSVDNLYYTYPTKYAYVACRSMIVDFIKQTYTQYNDASYCRSISDDIIDMEECQTTRPTEVVSECTYFSPTDSGKTWSEALDYCENVYGTTLARISSVDELEDASITVFQSKGGFSTNYQINSIKYWIGLSDIDKDGVWHWTDGTQNDWDNWNPESFEFSGGNRYCGSVEYTVDSTKNYATTIKGISINCQQKRRFICQPKSTSC